MSARKMFEELEMFPDRYTDTMWEDILEYSNKTKTMNVRFYLFNNFVEVRSEQGFATFIDMNLLKAINKQCEELEWNKWVYMKAV